MNKAEFVDLVKDAGKLPSKKDAEIAVNAFIAAVEKALGKKKSVELVGFGKFEAVMQKGKTGKSRYPAVSAPIGEKGPCRPVL